MSISIFSLSCPISDRCFAPFTAFSGDTLTAVPLCWAGYLLSSRDQGPLAPVLATRICIGLMLEFVCLAMVPEFHPLDRLPPSRAGQRGHRPSGVHRFGDRHRRCAATWMAWVALGSGVGVAVPHSKTATLCHFARTLAEFGVGAGARRDLPGQPKVAVYLSVAHGGGCRLRYPLPQTPAKVSYAHAPHHP